MKRVGVSSGEGVGQGALFGKRIEGLERKSQLKSRRRRREILQFTVGGKGDSAMPGTLLHTAPRNNGLVDVEHAMGCDSGLQNRRKKRVEEEEEEEEEKEEAAEREEDNIIERPQTQSTS